LGLRDHDREKGVGMSGCKGRVWIINTWWAALSCASRSRCATCRRATLIAAVRLPLPQPWLLETYPCESKCCY
jgi:hypothetical protein